MSGSHGHALYVHADTPIHRLAPQVKILSAVTAVLAVISTPREAFWAFAAYAAILAALVLVARIPIRVLVTRSLVLTPFLVLALLFPLFGPAPMVEVLGVSLSQPGLWDMWNLIAKSGLGLLTTLILGATTEVPDLLKGMSSLRVPALMTAILGFMVRYIDVIVGDFTRMRLALAARGHQTRGVTGWGPYGKVMGTMFLRTYERGERVYLAMESRGYSGEMPASSLVTASGQDWAMGLGLAALFWLAMALARAVG